MGFVNYQIPGIFRYDPCVTTPVIIIFQDDGFSFMRKMIFRRNSNGIRVGNHKTVIKHLAGTFRAGNLIPVIITPAFCRTDILPHPLIIPDHVQGFIGSFITIFLKKQDFHLCCPGGKDPESHLSVFHIHTQGFFGIELVKIFFRKGFHLLRRLISGVFAHASSQ